MLRRRSAAVVAIVAVLFCWLSITHGAPSPPPRRGGDRPQKGAALPPPIATTWLSLLVGLAVGMGLPCLLFLATNPRRYDYGPDTAIAALDSEDFFDHVGKRRPCVVLFHAMTDPDCQAREPYRYRHVDTVNSHSSCQDFRYDFEHIYEKVRQQCKKEDLARPRFFTVDYEREEELGDHFDCRAKASSLN